MPWSSIWHFIAGKRSAPRVRLVHADTHVQHALAQAVGEHLEVEAGAEVPDSGRAAWRIASMAALISVGVRLASRTSSSLAPACGS